MAPAANPFPPGMSVKEKCLIVHKHEIFLLELFRIDILHFVLFTLNILLLNHFHPEAIEAYPGTVIAHLLELWSP
jgi:hypothetical protein